MKPLSALKYLCGNPKKALPVIVSLAIGVFLVYFYSLFSITTLKAAYAAQANEYKNYISVSQNEGGALPRSFLDSIKNCRGVSKVLPAYLDRSLRYSNGMSSSNFSVYRLFKSDTRYFLNSMGAKLLSGELPAQGKNEIIVNARFAAQRSLHVGDYIGSAVCDNDYLSGKYRICGIMDCPDIFAVTCSPKQSQRLALANSSVLINIKGGKSPELKALLSKLPQKSVYYDYDAVNKMVKNDLGAVDMGTVFITALMVIVLCIALSNLNHIIFANRRSEFAILQAIGFQKTHLLFKVWKESALSCFIGYALGILITDLAGFLLNITVYHMQGKELCLYSPQGMLAALIIPAAVSFVSLIPCLTMDFSIEKAQGM